MNEVPNRFNERQIGWGKQACIIYDLRKKGVNTGKKGRRVHPEILPYNTTKPRCTPKRTASARLVAPNFP